MYEEIHERHVAGEWCGSGLPTKSPLSIDALCTAKSALRPAAHLTAEKHHPCVAPTPRVEWQKTTDGRWVQQAQRQEKNDWSKTRDGKWAQVAQPPKVMMGVSALEMHGRHLKDNHGLSNPMLATFCEQDARPGYDTQQAHEYLDDPTSLAVKVRWVADLLRRARKPILYTGAGISTASGIRDYASEAAGGASLATQERKVTSPWEASPTVAHRVMTAVHEHVTPLTWVQQNHDGLPQKAGFPQEHLNEIHGAWYDPSNPVVSDLLNCQCLCGRRTAQRTQVLCEFSVQTKGT